MINGGHKSRLVLLCLEVLREHFHIDSDSFGVDAYSFFFTTILFSKNATYVSSFKGAFPCSGDVCIPLGRKNLVCLLMVDI